MKFMNHIRAAARAIPLLLLAALIPGAAVAQVVTKLPVYLDNNVGSVYDFGNGPMELIVLQGSSQIFTSQSSGVGTASASTALTLTATPATPPVVGGFITCATVTNCSIPANTTVTAFNGTTGVTLSASSTVTAAQVNWGAACPTAVPTGSAVILTQPGQPAGNNGIPLYTQARICGMGQYSAGATVIPFPIGSH